jgi:hypothetical protein
MGKVNEKLKAKGFTLVSQNRHLKFRDADGRTVVMSSTPSDVNAEWSQLRDIDRIAIAPIYTPVSATKSTATLRATPKKRKSKASGGHAFLNAKVVTYVKAKGKSTPQEVRNADRQASEWNRLLHRMTASSKRFEKQLHAALTYAYTLVLVMLIRERFTAKELRGLRKESDFSRSRLFKIRSKARWLVRREAELYVGEGGLEVKYESALPWILGFTSSLKIGSNLPQNELWPGGLEWAMKHFLYFVDIPKWLGDYERPTWDNPKHRRMMRVLSPPDTIRHPVEKLLRRPSVSTNGNI